MVSTVRIIGDGVIGLATAVVAAARGHQVTVYGPGLLGAASPASAGMLAPSVERSDGPAQAFSDAAREAWPRLLHLVRQLGDPGFELRRRGILQVAHTAADAQRLQRALRGADRWLDADAARAAEPGLAPHTAGAAHFVGDGMVDVLSALAALRRVVARHPGINLHAAPVTAMVPGAEGVGLTDAHGTQHPPAPTVLAAGAWSATLAGLPRPIPVNPLRGTLAAVVGTLVREPIYGADGHIYVLPRGDTTVIGATSDWVGFDAQPGPNDVDLLRAAGARLVPALAHAPLAQCWTGLRPMTPDRSPIIGRDPDHPGLLYACGHSRNGFLHAALTAEAVVDQLEQRERPDLAPFGIARFTAEHRPEAARTAVPTD
jgi:glycine oxidase